MSAGFIIFTREAAQALTDALRKINTANSESADLVQAMINHYGADQRVELAAMQGNVKIGQHIIEMQDVILAIIRGDYS